MDLLFRRGFLRQRNDSPPASSISPSEAQTFDHTLTVLEISGSGDRMGVFLQTLVNSFPPRPPPQTALSTIKSFLNFLVSSPAPQTPKLQLLTPTIGFSCWHVISGTTRLFATEIGGCRPSWMYKMEAEYYRDATALIWLLRDTEDERQLFAEMREELGRAIREVRDARGKVPVVFFVDQSMRKDGEKGPARWFDKDDLRTHLDRPEVLGNRDWDVFWGDTDTGRGMGDAVDWLNCLFRTRDEKPILHIDSAIEADGAGADEKTLTGYEDEKSASKLENR